MQAVRADTVKGLEGKGFAAALTRVKGEKPKCMALHITYKEI